MSAAIQYFKRYYRGRLYQCIKLYKRRTPMLQEIVGFYERTPYINMRDVNLDSPTDRDDYQTLLELAIPISKEEYQQAYRRATDGEFSVFINGMKVAME